MRTNKGELFTANKAVKSHSQYRHLSEHLTQSNYRVQDLRSNGLNFLILSIGKTLIKLTEKEFVNLDKRELTLAKLNLLQKQNEPVVLDESSFQSNKQYEMNIKDLESNFKLMPIQFHIKQS